VQIHNNFLFATPWREGDIQKDCIYCAFSRSVTTLYFVGTAFAHVMLSGSNVAAGFIWFAHWHVQT
jgi:hypothetical protein